MKHYYGRVSERVIEKIANHEEFKALTGSKLYAQNTLGRKLWQGLLSHSEFKWLSNQKVEYIVYGNGTPLAAVMMNGEIWINENVYDEEMTFFQSLVYRL